MDCYSSTNICGVLLSLHLGGGEEVGFSIWIGEGGSGIDGCIFRKVRVMVFPSRSIILFHLDFCLNGLGIVIDLHRFAFGTEHREH
jgi:hypothetical protein